MSYLLLQILSQNPTDTTQTASVAVIPYHFQNKNKLVEILIFHHSSYITEEKKQTAPKPLFTCASPRSLFTTVKFSPSSSTSPS